MLAYSSFGVAVLSLIVSIVSFVLGDEDNKGLRQGFGVICFLLTILFVIIGVLAFVGDIETSTTTKSDEEMIAPVLLPTPTPLSIGMLMVPGNSSEGTRFTASQSGMYIFRYVRGAYSTYPTGLIPVGQATWLTAVRIFKNRPIEWNGVAISDHADYRAVDYAYFYSQPEAEARAGGQRLTVSLLKGDDLILVAVDGRPYYSDNPGEVVFEVLFISER